jgi:hypothetical protein
MAAVKLTSVTSAGSLRGIGGGVNVRLDYGGSHMVLYAN